MKYWAISTFFNTLKELNVLNVFLINLYQYVIKERIYDNADILLLTNIFWLYFIYNILVDISSEFCY